MVFVVGGKPEPPLDKEDLRAYREELKHMLASAYPDQPGMNVDKAWAKVQSRSDSAIDAQGRPVLEMESGDDVVQLGASAGNVLRGPAPPQLVRQLMEARLQAELRGRSARGLSEAEVVRDWNLLQKTLGNRGDSALACPLRTTIRKFSRHSAVTSAAKPNGIKRPHASVRPSSF